MRTAAKPKAQPMGKTTLPATGGVRFVFAGTKKRVASDLSRVRMEQLAWNHRLNGARSAKSKRAGRGANAIKLAGARY
jgi:hypothetical protein